jgi:PKD repeat protein
MYDGSNHNLVQGNWLASAYDGVNTMYDNATGNIIRDNVIGESVYGEPAPMAWWGVHIRYSTTDHQVVGNTIRNATLGGVGLAIPPNGSAGGERRILISHNIITDTSGPAIYLTPSSGASAPGSNNLFPAPVITSATTVQVSGTGVAGSTVEVYRASRPAGQSGLPIAFLGSGLVAGNGTWSVPVTVTTGDRVTALEIATTNNTSMIGTNVTATFQAPPPAPVANFNWSQQAGGRTVAFTDTSTNTPTSWSWNFGDSTTSTEQNPSHTYAAAGSYSVQLTATNGGGSNSVTKTVSVTDPVVTAYAADAFGRTVANGWGTADLGGTYTLTGTAANFSVGAGVASIVLPAAGALRSALLAGVSAQDVDIKVRVSTDKLPTGGGYWVYLVARRNGTNEYRPKIHVFANGSIAVNASRVINNSETAVAPEVTVAGLSSTANSYIWIRAQVIGTGSTTIRIKAWADGQSEPVNWQFSATDTTAALQGAGNVGLRAYIGGNVSNAPLTFRFDDYSVIAP